jgi:hypothetical protein
LLPLDMGAIFYGLLNKKQPIFIGFLAAETVCITRQKDGDLKKRKNLCTTASLL